MLLSTQQKAIIIRIAKEQVKSFVKISKHDMYDQIKAEMQEDGYDINDSTFLAYFAEQAELWDSLMTEPDSFLTRLDQMNLDMLRHILFQEFDINNTDTKYIWRKLNIADRFNIAEIKPN